MIPEFTICSEINNSILITDETNFNGADNYLNEDSEFDQKQRYKYSLSATVNIIKKLSVEENTIIATEITDHQCSEYDELHYSLPSDGWYQIHHFIVPTIEWLESADLSVYEQVIVTDNNNLYLYNSGNLEKIEPQNLLDLVVEDSTIQVVVKDIFTTYNIRKCLIDYCKKLMKGTLSKCRNKDAGDLEFRRDFVWMTLNVIKYYIEAGSYESAQITLEEVNGCNGFCLDIPSIKTNSCSCGCS